MILTPDLVEDHSSCFTPGPERAVMDQFVFERTEETLSSRIVVTVPRRLILVMILLFEHRQISRARVLPTLIGMMDQPGFHSALE